MEFCYPDLLIFPPEMSLKSSVNADSYIGRDRYFFLLLLFMRCGGGGLLGFRGCHEKKNGYRGGQSQKCKGKWGETLKWHNVFILKKARYRLNKRSRRDTKL